MEIRPIPIHNSYWIIPRRFRAGEYPGSLREDEARGKLQWLIDQGIDVLIDLTENGESDFKYYANLLPDIKNFNGKPVTYTQKSIKDFTTCTNDLMVEILNIIDMSLFEGRNIYLHCYGGTGRTGMVVGCYMVRHGIRGDEALEMIQELRKGIAAVNRRSPETEGQRRMVLEWKTGQ